MTLRLNGPGGSGEKPLATIAVRLPPLVRLAFVRLRFAPGKVCVGSLAATLSAPGLEAGVPVMYALPPLFPDEATTITPSRAALVDATASGESAPPNGEPSDMLITSMLF